MAKSVEKNSEGGDWLSLTSSRNNDNLKWFGHNQLIAAAEVDLLLILIYKIWQIELVTGQ